MWGLLGSVVKTIIDHLECIGYLVSVKRVDVHLRTSLCTVYTICIRWRAGGWFRWWPLETNRTRPNLTCPDQNAAMAKRRPDGPQAD